MSNEVNTKSGFFALAGKPNTGKSTLLNAIIGQKVAIVSSKPQTTRNRIMGVLNGEFTQAVFIDTPGVHKSRTKLGEFMNRAAFGSLDEVDAVILVVEPSTTFTSAEEKILDNAKKNNLKVILVINKIDLIKKETIFPIIDAYKDRFDFYDIIPISALKGYGVDTLKEVVSGLLQSSPLFFPVDMVSDQSEEVLVTEIIREQLLRTLEQEIPHGTAVEIEKFEFEGNLLSIRTVIYCEKQSHKGIIIGKKGETLKKMATNARCSLENIFGCKVFLECFVKVKEDWRNNQYLMRGFGYE